MGIKNGDTRIKIRTFSGLFEICPYVPLTPAEELAPTATAGRGGVGRRAFVLYSVLVEELPNFGHLGVGPRTAAAAMVGRWRRCRQVGRVRVGVASSVPD